MWDMDGQRLGSRARGLAARGGTDGTGAIRSAAVVRMWLAVRVGAGRGRGRAGPGGRGDPGGGADRGAGNPSGPRGPGAGAAEL